MTDPSSAADPLSAADAVPAVWVIDASVTLPWFFPDEATPFTEQLLEALGRQPVWAPVL